MTFHQGKYRVESTRLPRWDYAAAGWYFITICTRERTPFFGDVERGLMRRSTIGAVAHQHWQDISAHFVDVQLGEFVVM
ncbi:MAG: transposase, partial [Chloroflexi bacterium]|nr:transposase [Chloroflexota bacterium]